MKKILFVFAFAFCVWFSFGSVSLADSNEAPNGESYNFVYHYYGNWTYQNFVYDAVYYTNLPLAAYDNDFYSSVDGELIKLDLTTNAPGVYTNALDVFRYNSDPQKTIDHCIYVKSGQKGYTMCPNPNYPAIQTDIPIFSDMDEMLIYFQSQNEIVYTYDSGIGYLSDVKSKSVIFNLFDIDTINSDNPDNRVLRTSWGVNTSTGINVSSGRYNNSHTISPYSNFQIQAKIHGYGHVVNSWTKKILRDLPSEGSWVDLPSDIPANSYRYDLSFDSLVNKSIFGAGTGTSYPNDSPYFGSMIESANVGLNESLDLNFDLYFRIIADRVDDPVLNADVTTPVCGPWICVKYSNIDTEVPKISVVGGTLDDNNEFNVDTSSDNPYSSSQSVPISVGSGSSVDDAANSVVSPLSSPISGILSSAEDFMDLLIGMRTFMGSFPELFSTVFSFLPAYVLAGISGSILLIILMRFLGR